MSEIPDDDLLPEYALDYSRARPNRFAGRTRAAVTLDDDVLDYLQARATAKGLGVADLVNDLLRRDIALIESVK
jgi:hypothetical protein